MRAWRALQPVRSSSISTARSPSPTLLDRIALEFGDPAIPIETRRLVVGKHRWRVELAFRNETGVTLSVIRPHVPGGTYFGLESFETASWHEVLERVEQNAAKPGWLADRFTPSRPGPVAPGQRWSGSFSGPAGLPARTPIRIVLGRFVITGAIPPGFPGGFLCISERVVQLE
jgi:hypothetical protein